MHCAQLARRTCPNPWRYPPHSTPFPPSLAPLLEPSFRSHYPCTTVTHHAHLSAAVYAMNYPHGHPCPAHASLVPRKLPNTFCLRDPLVLRRTLHTRPYTPCRPFSIISHLLPSCCRASA